MSPALILAALAFLLAYGVLCFYFGVRSAVDDYEARLQRMRAQRWRGREDELA